MITFKNFISEEFKEDVNPGAKIGMVRGYLKDEGYTVETTGNPGEDLSIKVSKSGSVKLKTDSWEKVFSFAETLGWEVDEEEDLNEAEFVPIKGSEFTTLINTTFNLFINSKILKTSPPIIRIMNGSRYQDLLVKTDGNTYQFETGAHDVLRLPKGIFIGPNTDNSKKTLSFTINNGQYTKLFKFFKDIVGYQEYKITDNSCKNILKLLKDKKDKVGKITQTGQIYNLEIDGKIEISRPTIFLLLKAINAQNNLNVATL